MKSHFGIAFIVGQLGLGGAEQQLYNLLAGLDRSYFRSIVITLGPQPHEYWEQPIRALDIPLWRIGRSVGRVGRTIQIARLLRSEKIQITHGWVLHANPYSAVASRLVGVPLRLGSMRENYRGIPSDKLVRWIGYRGLDILVTNSAIAAHQVQELGLTKANVRAVPNGIRIKEPLNQLQRSRLKSELGFSDADLLVGSIGRLDSNKNYTMLLQAFAALIEKWPMLRLVIIGDGPLRSQLAAAAEQLGIAKKVCFPGAIAFAARYLPAMEVFCLTSHTEGMPNVIMEAAAAGLPIVSTACGGSVELVEHSVTGFLVPPNDNIAMSSYLDLLLADSEQRYRLGQAGREKMRRDFTIKLMVTRMTKVYEEALIAKGLT